MIGKIERGPTKPLTKKELEELRTRQAIHPISETKKPEKKTAIKEEGKGEYLDIKA